MFHSSAEGRAEGNQGRQCQRARGIEPVRFRNAQNPKGLTSSY